MAGETQTSSPAGPVREADRVLAPDLSRGAMLLLIALANAACVFLGTTPGVDTSPHGAERVYNVFLFMFAHACALPLFVMTFGYGLVQSARRQDAAGASASQVRGLLVRRHLWLVAFGAVHGILLFSGDILGAYGIVGLAFTLILLRRGDRVHRLALVYLGAAVVYLLVLVVVAVRGIAHDPHGQAPMPVDPFVSPTATSYGASLADRLHEWPLTTVTFLGFILIAWVGAWAGRQRVLEEPDRHRRLLRVGLVGGFGLTVIGGLPMGLVAGDFLHVDAATAPLVRTLYQGAGLFGGIGYMCLFGLLGRSLTRRMADPRGNVVIGAVTALGQRSLSGYLFQSVAWLALAAPFTLRLGQRSSSPTFVAAGCAVGVWLISLLVAVAMQRRSYRGPAETLLRRLTYGRPAAASVTGATDDQLVPGVRIRRNTAS